MANHRRELLEQLQQHQIILVAGDTGCGKSTQVRRHKTIFLLKIKIF